MKKNLCHFPPILPSVLLYLHNLEAFAVTKVMVITYSWSSVISFSFASTSSRRLLICFWCVSRWLWICCSTACCYKKKKTNSMYLALSCYNLCCLKKRKKQISLPWLHLQFEPYLSALSPSHGLFLEMEEKRRLFSQVCRLPQGGWR